MLEIPEQQTQPKQPTSSSTQTAPKKGISWKKIIVSVVVITLVAGIIAGGLYWFFVLNEEETTTTETTKVSTPSSKQATPSTEKVETVGWKTVVGQTTYIPYDNTSPTHLVKFSFKYPPPDFKVKKGGKGGRKTFVTNDPNYPGKGALKTVGKMWFNPTTGPHLGVIQIDTPNYVLGGKNAMRGTPERGSPTGSIDYYVSSVNTDRGKQVPFQVQCLIKTAEDSGDNKISDTEWKNFIKTCDLIATTFKFLD